MGVSNFAEARGCPDVYADIDPRTFRGAFYSADMPSLELRDVFYVMTSSAFCAEASPAAAAWIRDQKSLGVGGWAVHNKLASEPRKAG